MRIYEALLRPALFGLDPETAHDLVTALLAIADKIPGAKASFRSRLCVEHPTLSITVAGMRFPNPVGLAAGFDKDCRLTGILPSLGFGFLELGTLTPKPQPGNPKPRLFRIPEAEALINRLGFNNQGAQAAARRLAGRPSHEVPIGINIGPNAATPPERRGEDYLAAFSSLRAFGDYFVINVSSPNTPGLRDLQERLGLERILLSIRSANKEAKPVFVKLSSDITSEQLSDLLPLLTQATDGVVLCNTTMDRRGLPEEWFDVRGGLSGRPLRDRSTNLIAEVYRKTSGRLPIIGVGGIGTAQDAYQKIRAGASLVQIYTGWVYRGPSLVPEILRGLLQLLGDHGLGSIAEAVGKSELAAGGAK